MNRKQQRRYSRNSTTIKVVESTESLRVRGKRRLFQHSGKLAWIAVSAFIFTFYYWTATSSYHPFQPRNSRTDFYNLLTDGFLAGHLYLPVAPAPELVALKDPYDPARNEKYRLHDASLYKNRYYLYFGLAPAVTLYLPWRLATGKSVSEDIAVTLFSFAGYTFSCLLLFLLLRASEIRVPWLLQGAAVIVLGLGQIAPIVLRRPQMYEVAISAAYCFLMGGVYFLARRVAAGGKPWLTSFAGLFLGLAAGSRPNCAIAAALFAILYLAYLARSDGFTKNFLLLEGARFLAPLALCGLALAWYNYARFDNPFEFGVHYQVGVQNHSAGAGMFASQDLLPFVYYYFFCWPSFLHRFPFLQLNATALPFGQSNPDGFFHEPIAGLIGVAPLCLAALALPVFFLWKRNWFDSRVSMILAGLYTSTIAMPLSIFVVRAAEMRYEMDFVPSLLVIALFSCFLLSVRHPIGWARGAIAGLTVAACVWGVIANMALSINSYGYPLDRSNPAVFRSVAKRFGAGPESFVGDLQALQFEGAIIFPHGPAEARDAILTTGGPEAGDWLFVQYVEDGVVQFAYDRWGEGGPYGPVTRISPGKPYHLSIQYASPERKLIVRLDDAKVLEYQTPFYPTSRDQVTPGENNIGGPLHIRPFSGKLHWAPNNLVVQVRY
jgi:hypothetical protein